MHYVHLLNPHVIRTLPLHAPAARVFGYNAGQHAVFADATLPPSAGIGHDTETRWVGRKRRKPVHGHGAHVATDQDAALIRTAGVTTASAHDAARLEVVLPPEPGEVYGDGAFASAWSDRLIPGRGGRPVTVQTGVWG